MGHHSAPATERRPLAARRSLPFRTLTVTGYLVLGLTIPPAETLNRVIPSSLISNRAVPRRMDRSLVEAGTGPPRLWPGPPPRDHAPYVPSPCAANAASTATESLYCRYDRLRRSAWAPVTPGR